MVRFLNKTILYAEFNVSQSVGSGRVRGRGIGHGYNKVDLKVGKGTYVEFKGRPRTIRLLGRSVDGGKQVRFPVFEIHWVWIVGQKRNPGECGLA